MKFEFYPVTKADHEAADKEYAERRSNTQKFYEQVAVKLETGEELNAFERDWIAAGVRHLATLMPEERPKPNKRPPKVPGDAAVMVALRVAFDGWPKSKAMEEQAERVGISEISTIEKAIAKQGYKEIKASMLADRKK